VKPPPGSQSPSPAPAWVSTGALVALVALVHGRSLGFGFVYDDRWTVLDNSVVHSLANLPHLLGAGFARAGLPDAGRPVMLVTEMVDWALGGGSPLVFHVQNLLWHAGVVCLAFATLRRHGLGAPLAWLTAALFAVHPLVVEPVVVINYREDLLAAFFTLLALRLGAETSGWAVLAAAGATLLGVLAKENAAVAPLLFAALIASTAERPLAALRARATTLLALALPPVLAFAWRWWAFAAPGVVSLTAEVPAQHHARAFMVPRGALSFLQGVGQFVWPRGLAPEYPDLPATPLVTALGWGALALLVALTALAMRTRRPLALGWSWAVLAYLPHLGLVPLTNLRADRYFYLPALGLALAAAALLHLLVARVARAQGQSEGPPGGWALAIGAGLLLALGARSLRQTRIWRDDLAVFTAAAASDPGSQRALVGLAAARLRAGQSLAALEAADAALALGEAARAREMRGIVLLAQGDASGAAVQLEAALREASIPHRPQVLFNLGLARARAGDLLGARAALQEAARLAPQWEKPALELARLERAAAPPRP
jgi:hypothetical protein